MGMTTPKERPSLSFKIILVQDEKEGFTAFFAQFPEVIAEGRTEQEAQFNLINALQVVLDYEASTTLIPPPNGSIQERDVNFEIA